MGLAHWTHGAPSADLAHATGGHACVVAIPARDEAQLIERCLLALGAQTNAPAFAVVLFLNNCTDETPAIVASLAPQLPFDLHVYQADLPAGFADAAWARRLAVNAAANLAASGGGVLTTDADSYVATDWIRSCLDAMDEGADIVCGFVAPDFSDAPALAFETLRESALEYQFSQLASELDALIDPNPYDPWPRHQVETGANLAVRAAVLRALGGIPHVCPGEDRAFVRMARAEGYRIRHAFKPHVTTSSRLVGRAVGGWSDDLKARATNTRDECHEHIEPTARVLRRAQLRRGLRQRFGTPAFARRTQRLLDAASARQLGACASFDAAWALLEEQSPLLRRRPLLRAALEQDLEKLQRAVEKRRDDARAEAKPAVSQVAGDPA